MKTYFFETVAVENSSDFYACSDIVKPFKVEANNINEAKNKYLEFVEDSTCIEISKTQKKKSNKIYIDTKDGKTVQSGYIFIGKTDVDFRGVWKSDIFPFG